MKSLKKFERLIERKYNKHQLVSYIYKKLKDSLEDEIKLLDSSEVDYLLVLTYLVIYKRLQIGVLVGLLHKKYDTESIHNVVIELANNELLIVKDSLLITVFDLEPEDQKEIERYMNPLPMVVEPRQLKSNKDSPYLTIKNGSIILRDNHTWDDINLDHINRINKIPYSINKRVWNISEPVLKDSEDSTKDPIKRRNQFLRLRRDTIVLGRYFLIFCNKFYLTWKYDKRGRCYDTGYLIKIQGTDYNKGVIEFNNKEVIKD